MAAVAAAEVNGSRLDDQNVEAAAARGNGSAKRGVAAADDEHVVSPGKIHVAPWPTPIESGSIPVPN
jgi:hypothetical protein